VPKGDGGLSIRNQKQMNEAFLMNMINKPDDIWCKVLYSKYGRNKDLRVAITFQPYDSPLWKALAGIWDQFERHVVWQLGDGQK